MLIFTTPYLPSRLLSDAGQLDLCSLISMDFDNTRALHDNEMDFGSTLEAYSKRHLGLPGATITAHMRPVEVT